MSKFIAQTEERCINCDREIPAGEVIWINEFDEAILCDECKSGETDLKYH